MKNIRIGNDIYVEWTILNQEGGEYDLTGKNLNLVLTDPAGRAITIKNFETSGNVISFCFYGKDQHCVGVYGLVLFENLREDGMKTVDKMQAFKLVPFTSLAGGEDSCSHLTTETVELESAIETLAKGDPGPHFTPAVDGEGNLSWTNNGGLPNPETVNIKGPKGDTPDMSQYATKVELTRVDNKATDALSNSSQAASAASEAQVSAANAVRAVNNIPVVKGDGEHSVRQEGEDATNHPYAKGARSAAWGRRTTAVGDNSFIEGNSSNVAPSSITANTDNATIKAAWNSSKFSLAKGQNSHVDGNNNLALANHASASGNQTVAEGQQSHTEGYLTETKNQSEHAEGRANKSNYANDTFGNPGNTIHSVGIGPNASNRKNAFEIMQNGDAYLLGVGGYDGTNPGAAQDLALSISRFITKSVNDLANYYPKSETYTRAEVDAALGECNDAIGTVSERVNLMEPYADWYDPFIWDDSLIWPGNSGGGLDVDVKKLLNSAPTIVVRGRINDGDKRFIVSHPLMDMDGAEIVLMRYAKANKKRVYDEDLDEAAHAHPKKGYCVASGSMAENYFTFSPVTDYDDLYDFLSNNIASFSRHFGIALRIPNPEWNRPATALKNGIYKGTPESLWSDVLPVGVSYDEENDTYGIGLI